MGTLYDPEYGKFTGAVSNVETRPGNLDKFHVSAQNLVPRLRVRDGSIMGIAAVTLRITFSGPIAKDRIAITHSFDYRSGRTPVNSLPLLQRDTELESFAEKDFLGARTRKDRHEKQCDGCLPALHCHGITASIHCSTR